MKKTISILLSLLLVLSLAACMKVKAGEQTGTEPATKDTAVVEATASPTPAPTPEPTEPPFDVAIAAANEKLQQVKSMHMDMEMDMGMIITIAMGELKQTMPMDINMLYAMDVINDPYVGRADVTMSTSTTGESMQGVIYVVKEGEDTILYASDDDGATWNKTVNPKDGQLPQGPNETLDMFSGEGVDLQLTGVEEVNGKPAKVYAGTIDGKLLQQVLNTSGAMNELSEAMGADMSEEALANLSDINVTVMIDTESGLPVRYVIDMAGAMKDLMLSALMASMGGELPEGVEMDIDMSAMVITMTLSNFDAVEPIEIPEAALNTPEL